MIVREPPYDLVALFADLDAQKLFEGLIERGQDSRRACTRRLRWRSLRDPRRDTVCHEPERALGQFLADQPRILVVWDHLGSGREGEDPQNVEESVKHRLGSAGNIPEQNILAVALEPEVEALFLPAWERVKQLLSAERGMAPPGDEEVLAVVRGVDVARPEGDLDFLQILEAHPKEVFEALVFRVRLRRAAPLYAKIGTEISLPRMKRSAPAERIAKVLAAWFPPE